MAANIRSFDAIKQERFNDEHVPTTTSITQKEVEETVEKLFDLFSKRVEIDIDAPSLLRFEHANFLIKSLTHLPTSYQCLDASRPWLCYWILHSLELLDKELLPEDCSKIVQFLSRCQSPEGGFAGGPGQFSHLAPTYAAVNVLCTIGTNEAYNIIDRKKLLHFLWSVRSPEGGFNMHVGGEMDIRGAYCAISIARLTNIYTDALFEKTAEWIVGCQTYEGGFSGLPGMEAHGGYAFCGLAALSLLSKEHTCDIKSLLRWTVNRQMRFEGGFQGRTNKLVDGCYSFWQGGVFPLLHMFFLKGDHDLINEDRWMFHQEALQEYILICCQNSSGGFIDKPTKHTDVYHTCYALSGLSVAQHSIRGKSYIVGSHHNELAPIHPMHNIGLEAAFNAIQHFKKLEVPQLNPS